MTYKMTDDRRKVLAEFEGVCWHEYHIGDFSRISYCSCGLVGYAVREICLKANADYDNDADMLRVFRKMTPEEWAEFRQYLLENEDIPDVARWIVTENPERALCLAADWIGRGKGCRDLKYHAANAAGAVSEDTRREP